MCDLDAEWLAFQNQIHTPNLSNYEDDAIKPIEEKNDTPKCSDIYISTQTKIAYLNSSIDLYNVFWNLDIMDYYIANDGIIKKSIKINCDNPEQVNELETNIKNEKGNVDIHILNQVNNPNARKVKFKDVRKIDVGLCKKDLTSYRKKKKGAFYNCFAIIMRVKYNDIFKEVHVKIFNTGKLEIPGIQYDELLTITLDKLINILKPLTNNDIQYNKTDISTVLINSNFTCGFYIDRFKLYKILKDRYNISAAYDPCSYPGIQCKFHYNKYNTTHLGYKINDVSLHDDYDENWIQISFMIFRTGSVLIVGNCDSYVLHIIYNFLKKLLNEEYKNIYIKNNTTKKKKAVKKIKKKTILFTVK
jgi:TATA-box binding protein (TBP) (component of TFIID and TFIIIB)